jgi:hypothetical protein
MMLKLTEHLPLPVMPILTEHLPLPVMPIIRTGHSGTMSEKERKVLST